ncbi:MAG: serpin family protein [Dehalococcoidia bacterium]|nr:serpin family protein [Dehalococcoidia bacterium]
MKMKKALFGFAAVGLSLALTACSTPAVLIPAVGNYVKSDKLRNTSPNVSSNNLGKLVTGNSAFALDLYQTLKDGNDGNLFYSPYSLSLALAMAYAGAKGKTASEMSDVMHFTLSPQALHAAFNYLALEIDKRGEVTDYSDGFALDVVNDVWGQQNFQFLAGYLDTLAENYGAGLRILDFENDAEAARQTINQYIEDNTNGRIKDLIPQGAITELTKLVLTNAIYFNASWETPFTKELTGDGVFTLLDDTQVSALMMRQSGSFKYAEGNGWQAVELPYEGGEIAMLVLLPGAGNFKAFEDSLDMSMVNGAVAALENMTVNLSLPKFSFDSSFGLKQALESMGMRQAFSDSADFSGITGTKELYIADVVHKAFVKVDETGTEAAAASGVIINATSVQVNQVTFNADRPFIFLIRDIPTGSILFVGRVMNPVA